MIFDNELADNPMLQSVLEILDCTPQPVLLVKKDLQILGINHAALDRYGVETTGQSLLAVLRQPGALTCIRQAQLSNQMLETKVMELKDGTETSLRLMVKPLKLPDMQFNGFAISLTDITGIDAVDEARKEFVANVSHELKSPLTTLSGFIETLKSVDNIDDQSRHRFLQVMEDEAMRMSHLVSDLLSLSKVEAIERIKPSTVVDIDSVINSAINSLLPLAESKNSEIDFVPSNQNIQVSGDWDQLKQVFVNLIDNAVKYSQDTCSVIVRCRLNQEKINSGIDTLCIDIVDQGPGIDSEHLPRLTERFYRVDQHRSRDLGGTGLGLAIVKHIVIRHRGRLSIKSHVGIGSTFTIMLPILSIKEKSSADAPVKK